MGDAEPLVAKLPAARPPRTKKIVPPPPKRRRSWWLLSILPLLLFLLAAGVAWYASVAYVAEGPLSASRAVVVPRGSPAQVAAVLRDAGVVGDARALVVAAELSRADGPLRAGELMFPEHASIAEVLRVLRVGRPVLHRLTIPEGLTAAQIAGLLDHADGLDGEPVVPREGQMLPQTYAYERGASRASVAQRATAAMDRALAQAWANRSPGLLLADPQQLLTLASIVERETSRPDERPHVAAVFLNRLRLRMRLQSDPTVIYAATGGLGWLDHGLTRAELEWPNPYNTYTIPGLPPSPIDSPGLASMLAVAQPLVSDDLYFVADGHGGHNFARTLEEHNRNVVHWRTLTNP